jgi:sulfopyruvate decarboxylase TPP-binding subunit
MTMPATTGASIRPVNMVASLDPLMMLDALCDAGITHVVTVPDTHQKSLLEALAAGNSPQLITVCTEDEAMGVNLGLFMGGQRPMLLIQNTGFFAAMNTIRGLSLDANVPACMLIGEFSRNAAVAPADHTNRVVQLLEPTLGAWQIPFYRLDHDADLVHISTAIARAWNDRGPVALIVGAPTAERRD